MISYQLTSFYVERQLRNEHIDVMLIDQRIHRGKNNAFAL